MWTHPVISILLAAWIGLGGTMAPRFLCSCADGTVSVEIGHQFCCDSQASCSDSCEGCTTNVIAQPGESGLGAWSCPGGCQSTLICDDVIRSFERGQESQPNDQSQSAQTGWTELEPRDPALMCRSMYVERPPDSRSSSPYQLRFVILLV